MVVSNYRSLLNYDYFDKLLWLKNVKLFRRQEKILYILDTTILILYRKPYTNIVSIIVLNIEARQYNININLARVQITNWTTTIYLFTLFVYPIIYCSFCYRHLSNHAKPLTTHFTKNHLPISHLRKSQNHRSPSFHQLSIYASACLVYQNRPEDVRAYSEIERQCIIDIHRLPGERRRKGAATVGTPLPPQSLLDCSTTTAATTRNSSPGRRSAPGR